MKDPLTQNLPEGWKHWAESNETRLLGLGVLIALNIYLSIRIGRSAAYNGKEMQFWFMIVWAFPIVGAIWAFHTACQLRKGEHKQKPGGGSAAL